MKNKTNKLLCLLLAVVMLSGVMAPALAAPMTFTDVKTSDWFYDDVKQAVELGLVNGRTATTYAPNEQMTYAEAIKLAACMHEKHHTGSVTLTNSTTGQWYESYVDYAKKNKIISIEYNWGAKATRAGYISIFAHALPDRALKAVNTVPDGSIPDVPMTHPQAAEIYKFYRAGIIQGVDEKYTCNEAANINRGEVAAILTRMMNENARKKFTVGGTTTPSTLTITTHPKDATVNAGDSVTFTVAVSGGKAPYKYEWIAGYMGSGGATYLKDSDVISGANTAKLTLKKVTAEHAKDYWCNVTDAAGNTVGSQEAVLTVKGAAASPLQITTQPEDDFVEDSGDATFSVAVSGGKTPYKYQWYRINGSNDKPLQNSLWCSGADTATVTVAVDMQSDGEKYYCVITDASGKSVTSNKASVTIYQGTSPLQITTQPESVITSKNTPFSFSVEVSGGKAPYTYQWRYDSLFGSNTLSDGNNWSGTTTASVTCKGDESSSALSYYCVITDAAGTKVTSDKVKYTILDWGNSVSTPLKITAQPKDVTVVNGGTATFTVEISGGKAPYKYQWETTISIPADGPSYQGTQADTLTVKKAETRMDGYQFYCTITDADGKSVTSDKATLTVTSGRPSRPSRNCSALSEIETEPH